MIRLILLLLICANKSFYFSQKKHQNSTIEKNAFSLNVMGCSSLGGMTYDLNFGKRFHLELGLGLIGIGSGLTCYPFKIKESKYCPYFGLKLSSLALVDVGGGTVAYVPFGFTYFSPI